MQAILRSWLKIKVTYNLTLFRFKINCWRQTFITSIISVQSTLATKLKLWKSLNIQVILHQCWLILSHQKYMYVVLSQHSDEVWYWEREREIDSLGIEIFLDISCIYSISLKLRSSCHHWIKLKTHILCTIILVRQNVFYPNLSFFLYDLSNISERSSVIEDRIIAGKFRSRKNKMNMDSSLKSPETMLITAIQSLNKNFECSIW